MNAPIESYPDDVVDRAREWLNETHPDLDGDEYIAALEEACAELAAIDAAADAADRAVLA